MSGETRREARRHKSVTIGKWIGMFFVQLIPVVNLVMLIVWAVKSKNQSKRNYCIAVIIFSVILITLCAIAIFFFGEAIAEFLANYNMKPLQSALGA